MDNVNLPDPVKTTAASVAHIGSIGEGKDLKRVSFEGATHASLKVAVRAEKELNFFQKLFLFTKVEKDVYINIRSASKRLGLSYWEVVKIAKQGAKHLKGAFTERQRALDKYETIVNNYVVDRGKLKPKQKALDDNVPEKAKLEKPTHLTAEVLLKTIQLGFKKLDQLDKNFFDPDYARIFHSKNLKTIQLIDQRQEIGKGGNVTVYKTFDFINKKFVASKETPDPTIKGNEELKPIIENEIKIHNILKKHPAFMTPPTKLRQVDYIGKNSGQTLFIYQTDLMDADLCIENLKNNNFYVLPIKEQFQACQNLVDGLAFMHSKKIAHKDIKPQNFLMKVKPEAKKPEEKFQFVFCDMGGSEEYQGKLSDKKVLKDENGKLTEMRTPGFTPYEGETEIQQDKADVFAFALSLIEMFMQAGLKLDEERKSVGEGFDNKKTFSVGVHPVKKDGDNYNRIAQHLREKQVPEEMIELLLKGIGPQDERPNAAQFKKEYDKLINKSKIWA